MRAAVAHDMRLELRFAETIKAILGRQFFTKNDFADKHEATDFAIFSSHPIRCAVRLRTYKWFLCKPYDVTIRWWRPNGVRTEIDKIEDGLVSHMFYGFVSGDENKIIAYSILKLPVPWEIHPFVIIQNKPRDSDLGVFKRDEFDVLKAWPA